MSIVSSISTVATKQVLARSSSLSFRDPSLFDSKSLTIMLL